MSRLRGLVPVFLATGFGVLNGYIIFQPAYQDLEAQKMKKLQESQSAELGPDLKAVPVSNTAPATPSSKPEGTRSES